MTSNPIKILIVDDSRIFRNALEQAISKQEDIEIIGSVRNGVKCLDFLEEQRPDIITLDLEMPEMDGIETLEHIMRLNQSRFSARPVGVIMLSAFTKQGAESTLKALKIGAFDFITKPEGMNIEDSIQQIRSMLLVRVRGYVSRTATTQAVLQKVKTESPKEEFAGDSSTGQLTKNAGESPSFPPTEIRAILIGVSTGGPRALNDMLPQLCELTDLPILIVQHMPPHFTQSLAAGLQRKCRHRVVEAEDRTEVCHNCIYIAPGGKHMVLKKNGAKTILAHNHSDPVCGCRPSVDVLFFSAAPVYGKHCVTVVLTGMGHDGTAGAGKLKDAGAKIVIQDEKSSVVRGMPGSVKKAGLADVERPLMEIPAAIQRIVYDVGVKK